MFSISKFIRSRWPWLAILPFVLLLASGHVQAQAMTEDFEGISCSGDQIPDGTAGLMWTNGFCQNGLRPEISMSGYRPAVTSGSNVIYNGGGNPMTLTKTGGGLFTLVQAQMTGAWNDNLQVQIEGFDGSTSVGVQTITLIATAPSLITFTTASNVDRVVFTSSGGTPHEGYTGAGTHFAMDDLSYVRGPIHSITVTPSLHGTMSCTPNPVADGGNATCIAVPDAGFSVASFSGCTRVGSTNDCELNNVTATATVAITFAALTYPITVTPPANGTMSCTPNPVAHGSNGTCTAVPDAGFTVASFSGCTRVASSNDCELNNVTAAVTVSAAFTALPVITTTGNLPDATEGQVYSQSLAATGGTAPYTWAVVDGSLPPGMTLDTATGVISGTVPKVAVQKTATAAKATGVFSFSVQVTDNSNPQLQSPAQQFSLQVVASPAAATATPVPTLGTWALALLGVLIAGLGLQRRSKMQG
ncbi:IPTL-CTERM sorting domain-containing protein [Comamonas sp. MYb396]|uniref:IPTL-CTERM sorting domain-containing protein n=1 Tax=Comamonas sp. MYb396 TaxID=2745302 RepID=UPI0030973E46